MNAILSDKTKFHCDITTVGPAQFIRELLISLAHFLNDVYNTDA